MPASFDFDPEVRPASARPLPQPIEVTAGPSFWSLLAAVFLGVFFAVWFAGLILWHHFLAPELGRIRDRIPQSFEIRR